MRALLLQQYSCTVVKPVLILDCLSDNFKCSYCVECIHSSICCGTALQNLQFPEQCRVDISLQVGTDRQRDNVQLQCIRGLVVQASVRLPV